MKCRLKEHGLDPIQVYRDEIASIPRISPERTRELGFQAEHGSTSAVTELTLTRLYRLFPRILAKVGRNADAQDCLQEASIDLLKSARNFRPSEHDGSFDTYVDYRVQRHLQETSAPTHRAIYISHQIRRYVRVWQRVQNAIFEKTGNRPTLEETVDFLPVKFLRKTLMWKKAEARLKKTNGDTVTPEEIECETRRSIKTGRTLRCVQDASMVLGMERMDVRMFEPHAPETPERQAVHAELIARVRSLIPRVLNARERFVIERRYLTEANWTQKQVADHMHCDKTRISQLENAAIEKLSHVMNRGTRVSSSGVQESVQDDDEYALISIGLPQPKVRLIQEMRKNVTRMAAQRCNGEDPVSLARRHTAVDLLFLTLSAWDGVLNDEEQQILSSIYLAPEPKTESVLGEELSLSPSTVNNRKKQAIDKLARAIIEAMAG